MRDASPHAAPESPSSSEEQGAPPHAARRAATDPSDDTSASLLAAAGAALTSRRAAAARTARKAGKAPVSGRRIRDRPASAGGGVGSVPGGRQPGARLAPLGLTPDDDGAAADSLRSWLAALATAPSASRYAKHKVAVVRTALRLLEAQR